MTPFYKTMPDDCFRAWFNGLSEFDQREYYSLWVGLLKTDTPMLAHLCARSEFLFDPEGVL